MSLKKSNIFCTVTFRLTVWYLVIFTILLVTLFLITDIGLRAQLLKTTDSKLVAKLSGYGYFGDLFDRNPNKAHEAIRDSFDWDSTVELPHKIFWVFLSPQGKVIISSNLKEWKGLDFDQRKLPDMPLMKDWPANSNISKLDTEQTKYMRTTTSGPNGERGIIALQTERIPARDDLIRVAYMKYNNNMVIVVGFSLRDNYTFIATYRKMFVVALGILLLCGGLLGYFIAWRAMSGVKRVTKTAIEVTNGSLNHRVSVGSEGLEIQDLAIAFNDMLERIQALVIELKEVTNNIAHDLRSPITRIRGLTETTMTSKPEICDYEAMSGEIIKECDRLTGMVNTMLEIAQADSGVLRITETNIDMNEIVRRGYELFLPVAEDKGARLELNLQNEPLIVAGDDARLQRAVANLIDNAIKYTNHSGQVKVSTQGDTTRVRIQIEDTGSGIEPQDMPHIFERFYRGDRSRSTQGNGLGLSLAQSIIKAHGGVIDVESTPGLGSRFTIILPRVSH
jgi:heavy metal sensor kinase